jgi:hypothetical protein
VRFEITHELDAPLDAVELAVLSPDLGQMMAAALGANIESVETVEHVLRDGELRRVLRFQANAPLPIFRGYNVAREAMTWEELSVYNLASHCAAWSVTCREQWRRYFQAEGTYRLEAAPDGRTRRTVVGDINIRLGMIAPLVERMAVAEVRKTYAAEADTLRRLATL